MMDKNLLKRLTKPDVSGSYGIVYWEIITHKEGVDDAFHNYFIKEKPAREYMLFQMKEGHISWKYRRVAYHEKLVEKLKFEDL